mgnify:FL=1
MATVAFTHTLQRHVACPTVEVQGATVREALDAVWKVNPVARGYVLDEQGELRKHMAVFLDGRMIRDRAGLTDAVRPDSKLYVMQALSGG